jgi:hypothetical protein
VSWPRLRALCRWSLTAGVLALAVALLASAWCSASFYRLKGRSYLHVDLDAGSLTVGAGFEGILYDLPKSKQPKDHTRISFETLGKPKLHWWFARESGPFWYKQSIPLWTPLLVLAIPAQWLWLSHQRALKRDRAGRCPSCAYDLRGLPEGAPCPECGAKS